MKTKYILKYHEIYYTRITTLKDILKKLKEELPAPQYLSHRTVKLAKRIYDADQNIIPQDPDRPEYKLKGDLKKYRRYKKGLQRYRLFFAFSSSPKIILYLYLNNEKELRKAGGRNDPYRKFKIFVTRGEMSPDPSDPKIQKWIKSRAWE